jgi:hypothetical protein
MLARVENPKILVKCNFHNNFKAKRLLSDLNSALLKLNSSSTLTLIVADWLGGGLSCACCLAKARSNSVQGITLASCKRGS